MAQSQASSNSSARQLDPAATTTSPVARLGMETIWATLLILLLVSHPRRVSSTSTAVLSEGTEGHAIVSHALQLIVVA